MVTTGLRWLVRPMRLEDIPSVMEIDKLSFPIPWPERTYRYEILENPSAHLLVIEAGQAGPDSGVAGFAGYWLVVDEAHISTFAVHPDHRGRGLGQALLRALLSQAASLGAKSATLEVRASNQAAQKLYREHGFVQVGLRRAYYRDNDEDAVLMTNHALQHPPSPGLSADRTG